MADTNENGNLLLQHERARIAEICDKCGAAIWPGDEMAIYIEHTARGPASVKILGASFARHYCAACGQKLGDSLVATEAQ